MNFEIAPKSTEIELNWYDAKLYCFSLNIDSKTGWRLPTKEELTEIYQSPNDFNKSWYWSSTEKDGHAWGQYFLGSYRRTIIKNYCGLYVRAIRDLKDN